MRTWIIRGVALTALAVVSWAFGPKAWVVLAARPVTVSARSLVDLDRVGPGPAPEWLRSNPALYRAVLEELSPHLERRVPIGDTAGLQALAGVLDTLSWVDDVRLLPGAGGGFDLRLELRRPVLEVVPEGPAAAQVPPVYVTADGICVRHGAYDLPSGLPRCRLLSGPVPGSLPVFIHGRQHPDPRVLAAAQVAQEWRDQLLPLVPQAPRLLEVDASNLNYALLADHRYSEIRVVVARSDGGTARLDYGLAPDAGVRRLPIRRKAAILRKLLARYPGLAGVELADLRLVNTWESWVRTSKGGDLPVPPGGPR